MPVTTYIIGAGASIHAGYPLARKMGEAFLEWERSQADRGFVAAYERYFARVDFEEALNDMANLLTKQNLSLTEMEDKVAFAYFGSRLRSWFGNIGTSNATAYKKFASQTVKTGDYFLSFNYDICMEDSLRQAGKWDIREGYGFGTSNDLQSSPTKLIKLHGSINWTIPLNSVSPDCPVIGRADCITLGYAGGMDQAISEPFHEAGPLLAVPTSEKKFYVSTSFGPRFEDFWGHLWDTAREYLSKSDVLVICGYSLPPADQRARETIFGGTKKTAKIVVVCGSGSQAIAGDFRQAGFTNVEVAEASRFEDWVASNSI